MTVACPHCDLLQRVPPLAPGARARCARCASTLVSRPLDPIDRPLALVVAAAIAYLVANLAPLMGLSAVGRYSDTTITGGAYQLWEHGEPLTALVVAFCAVVAPGAYILFMLVVLLAARRPPVPAWIGRMLRWASSVEPWSMSEVMILGILVALIKIAEVATVEPGAGIYAVGALVVLLSAISVTFEVSEVWERVEWAAR
jgi:paraquat-inducible protein A